MRQLDRHPIRVLAGLLVLAFALFNISGIPAIRYATSGPDYVIGEIVWFGFLLSTLAFLVTGVVVVVRHARRGRSAA